MKKGLDQIVDELRAAGEPTRARVIALLRQGELSVGELAQILGQSQPRLSRHMKFLTAAGVVERLPEGSWVFYRLTGAGRRGALVDAILTDLDDRDPVILRDAQRLDEVRAARRQQAMAYFERHAGEWDAIRETQFAGSELESVVLDAAGPGPFRRVVDFGTGTGRMLAVFADRAREVEGIDLSHQMLTVARANLSAAGVSNCVVRHGDATAAPFDDASADLVIIHQVLHFLEDPGRAIHEAARILAPGGRLVVVDFAPHANEDMRRDHSHRHLGFSEDFVRESVELAGLEPCAARRVDGVSGDGPDVFIWTARSLAPARAPTEAIA